MRCAPCPTSAKIARGVMNTETFWGVFTPFIVFGLIVGIPRWGAKHWYSSRLFGLGLLCFGALSGAIPAYFEGKRDLRTVYNKRLPGSCNTSANGTLPPITDAFNVRRAGVEHEITFGPSKRTRNRNELPDVTVRLTVFGPDGQTAAAFENVFHGAELSYDEDVFNWTAAEVHFTPAAPGLHRFVLHYDSGAISELFLHVEDSGP